jgi:hypothetical protein
LRRRGDRLVRWGGLALIAAGVLGLVASGLFAAAVLRAPEGVFSYAYDRFYAVASFLQQSPKWILICVGLAGLYFLLDAAPKPVRRMALGGVALVSLTFAFPLVLLLGQALGPDDAYGASSGPFFSEAFFYVFLAASGAGMVLCGVVAFWTRGLGRWRFAVLVVGAFDSPFLYWVVFVIVRNSIGPLRGHALDRILAASARSVDERRMDTGRPSTLQCQGPRERHHRGRASGIVGREPLEGPSPVRRGLDDG